MKHILRITSLLLVLCLTFTACKAGSKPPAESDVPDNTDNTVTASPSPSEMPEPSEIPEVSGTPDVLPNTPTPAPTLPSPTPTPSVPETDQVDLQAFYDSVTAVYELGSVVTLDNDLLDAYYAGLTSISTKQLIAKAPMITALVSEIVLVECESEDDVEAVLDILNARKQAQVDGGAWYPASIEEWEKAEITSSGRYVMLIANANAADIATMFYALFA